MLCAVRDPVAEMPNAADLEHALTARGDEHSYLDLAALELRIECLFAGFHLPRAVRARERPAKQHSDFTITTPDLRDVSWKAVQAGASVCHPLLVLHRLHDQACLYVTVPDARISQLSVA